MNRERLELMATMLREVVAGTWKPTVKLNDEKGKRRKAPKFDLSNWVERPDRHNPSCGFSACAVGHALLDARFTLLGLRKSRTMDTPWFQGSIGFDAVAEFFEFPTSEAKYLFSPMRYASYDNKPEAVVQRIERVLAEDSNHE